MREIQEAAAPKPLDEPSNTCPHCKQQTESAEALAEHIKAEHTTVRYDRDFFFDRSKRRELDADFNDESSPSMRRGMRRDLLILGGVKRSEAEEQTGTKDEEEQGDRNDPNMEDMTVVWYRKCSEYGWNFWGFARTAEDLKWDLDHLKRQGNQTVATTISLPK